MWTYIAKRLLLMIPTLFGISLVIFLIINMAPGKPGAAKAQQSGEQAGARESYRVFKEQFHLDKPILLNTRPWLKTSDIEKALRTIAAAEKDADVVKAREWLEDLGQDAVPFLVGLLRHEDPRIVDQALAVLPENAPRRVREVRLDPDQQDYSPAQRAQREANIEIQKEAHKLRALALKPDDPPDRRKTVIHAWETWYNTVRERFARGVVGTVGTFLFDTRYGHYMGNLLTGNLGVSSETRRPVWDLIRERLPRTITIAFLALLLEYLIAVPIGIFAAVRQNRLADRGIAVVLFMLYSLPSFYVGTLLLAVFTIGEPLQIFPTGGFGGDNPDQTLLQRLVDIGHHLVLPVTCLSYASFAALSRFARVGIIEVIRSDFVRTARAKGLPETVVILKHTLRNGVIPLLTLMAGILPMLVGGAIIVEFIFNIPGVGLLHLDSINTRDWNVIMGIDLFVAVLVLVGILLTDIAYALVDPRITYASAEKGAT